MNYFKTIALALFTLLITLSSLAQNSVEPTEIDLKPELKGTLFNFDTKEPLAYANVVVLNKKIGTITNEKGIYSLNTTGLNDNDTVSFIYIGYQTKTITFNQLKTEKSIYLKEEIFNLNETFIFAKERDPEMIVEKVLENLNINYKKRTSKNQTFIRNRSISDITKFKMEFKKSSFAHLNEKLITLIEKKLPKHSVSYTDFLGDIYFSKNDSTKVKPTKAIGLKEKDIADLKQLESMFDKMFINTKENEYWKIKSGILGSKIDLEDDIQNKNLDSLKKYNSTHTNTSQFNGNYRAYKILSNKKRWDFLHNTNKYKYTLLGGTKVNGEDVYIIDFIPNKKGLYTGRVYISMNTYALIKADYNYAVGKIGQNVQLLGVGYTMNKFSTSIYFEKDKDNYHLKYYSRKTGAKMSIERNLSLLKKKKRFLIDKKLNEIKVGLDLGVNSEESFEILVLKEEAIADTQYANFKQKKKMNIKYVDQFDDNIWKGYSVIEPTEQMKNYKKQGL